MFYILLENNIIKYFTNFILDDLRYIQPDRNNMASTVNGIYFYRGKMIIQQNLRIKLNTSCVIHFCKENQ